MGGGVDLEGDNQPEILSSCVSRTGSLGKKNVFFIFIFFKVELCCNVGDLQRTHNKSVYDGGLFFYFFSKRKGLN